jgi:hypothetical protein
MTIQRGRDGEEVNTRRDGMTERRSASRRIPGAGMSAGRGGVKSELVDFDDIGDLHRREDDAFDAEPNFGPDPATA